MTTNAFDFALPETRRQCMKPRASGLTMMMDIGIPLGAQEDWLGLIAPFIDVAKLVTGTASLYQVDYLKRKLDLYERHQVKTFIGGNFLESLFARDGFDGAKRLFDECCRLGIDTVEVSSTIVPIDLKDRLTLVKQAIDAGLQVHAEIGAKVSRTAMGSITEEIGTLIDAGAENITVEGAELMSNGVANKALCDEVVATFDVDRTFFELCGPWLPRVQTWEMFAVMRFLVATFGPNVNIGNASPEMVVEIEAQRRGLNE